MRKKKSFSVAMVVAAVIMTISILTCGAGDVANAASVTAKFPQTTKVTSATPVKVTVGSVNALTRAKQYLSYMAFSKSGLIKQLKFEGYTAKEAKYAVNHVSVNWKKQAVKKAQDYLDLTAFSKSGLIKQLKFEGFTAKQAKYAAKKVGY